MTAIKTSYNNQKLKLIESYEDRKSWKEYPVMISDIEKQTMNFDRVISIMREDNLQPSALAKLEPGNISRLIQIIDTDYNKQMSDYKISLAKALGEDLKNIRHIIDNRSHLKTLFGAAGGGLACYGLAWGLTGPIGLCIGAGSIAGAGLGFLKVRHDSNNEIAREGKAHRYKWMHEVDCLEKKRLETLKFKLIESARPLLKDYNDLKDRGERCLEKKEELIVISKVFRACLNEDLIINNVNVENHLLIA